MKRAWMKIVKNIADEKQLEKVKCPNCLKDSLDYMYVGDERTRVGFLQVWCNNCLKGIYISRTVAPINAKFVTFEAELESIIPQYDFDV